MSMLFNLYVAYCVFSTTTKFLMGDLSICLYKKDDLKKIAKGLCKWVMATQRLFYADMQIDQLFTLVVGLTILAILCILALVSIIFMTFIFYWCLFENPMVFKYYHVLYFTLWSILTINWLN